MSVVITNPQKIKVMNVGAIPASFVPYKENFTCALEAGKGVEFEVKSASEALYYLNLGIKGLDIETIADFDDDDDILVIESSTTITLTNEGAVPASFVPYKENFTQALAVGDAITIPAANVNQFLYYLKQSADSGIVVDFE